MTTTTIREEKTATVVREQVLVATGAAAAAMIASGMGALVIGLMTTGAEISEGLKTALTWSDPVGPLSGKTGVGIIVWLLSWIAMNTIWKDKEYNLGKAFTITLVLIGLGALFTFPPFFELFAE